MLEHTTVKSEEEMELDKNNKENNKIKEEIKEEEKNSNEISNENNNINDSSNNNQKIGLGFFGRLMAPIFLTESEINNING